MNKFGVFDKTGWEKIIRQRYLVERKNLTEVGAELGASDETVSRFMRSRGIPVRGVSKGIFDDAEIAASVYKVFYQKHWIERKNVRRTAREMGLAEPDMYAMIRKLRVVTYPTWVALMKFRAGRKSRFRFFVPRKKQMVGGEVGDMGETGVE